jgi:hypothetical protein
MKKIFSLLFLILLLTGCGSKPPVPSWIAAGHQQLENYKQDFLTGRSAPITEIHFRSAIVELTKGGDVDLLGKAWLTRMALQIAVLREPEEGDFLKVDAVESVPANRSYYLFLKRGGDVPDVSPLPERYLPFQTALKSGDAAKTAGAIATIDDPLSRLIAAGLAVRHKLETEPMLQTAVETASRNGWKTALLAWLERLRSFYEAAGQNEKASSIRSRIELVSSS